MFSYALFFLNYLYAKKRDKSNVIYSHIELVRKRKYLFLQIFFYDSTLSEVFKSFGAALFKYLAEILIPFLLMM